MNDEFLIVNARIPEPHSQLKINDSQFTIELFLCRGYQDRNRLRCQNIAQFLQLVASGGSGKLGGDGAEGAAECLGKVAVAGVAQVQGQRGQVALAIGDALQGGAQTQLILIFVDGLSRALPEDAAEAIGRTVDGGGNLIQRESLVEAGSEQFLNGTY